MSDSTPVAPVGAIRPLPPRANLSDCRRPRYRVFRMGGDIFFNCELKSSGDGAAIEDVPLITRVI